MTGIIVMWSGSVESIPSGWRLCNGQYGTPDLRNRFVMQPVADIFIGQTGGAAAHSHSFTGDGHEHEVKTGDGVEYGYGLDQWLSESACDGETDPENNIPPYYALCFIMKMGEPE